MVTCEHPIDFGNVGMILCGLIPAMAITCGLRLTDKRVLLAMIASAMMVVEAISFSTFIGAGVAIGLYLMLRYVRFSEYLLVPGMVAAALAGFVFTASLLDVDLEAIRPPEGEAALAGSYFVRVLIVQNSWNSYGNKAGLLGFGTTTRSPRKRLVSTRSTTATCSS